MCSPCGLPQGFNYKDAAPKHHPQVRSYFICITMNPDISKAADIYYNHPRHIFLEQIVDETYDELNVVLEDRELSFFYQMLQGVNELDESYL